MRILSIGGDKQTLQGGSEPHARAEMMRAHVQALDVFVWPHVHTLHDIFRALRSRAYDVVTAQDPFWRGLVAWVVARAAGIRLNLQVHTDLSAQVWWRRIMARALLRRAHSVRTVSSKIADQVRQTTGNARVHVLPIYVDLSRFTALQRLPHGQPTMLWIGRFESEKDPLRAIEVLRAVRARGQDAKLVMLGAGRLEAALRKASKGLPVEFPGWKPPEEYLSVADVVLSTSRHESWGASIIEALAAGVPVVAPDVGIAEEAGATVVPRSQYAAAVVKVLSDKPRAQLKLQFLDRETWVARWKESLR